MNNLGLSEITGWEAWPGCQLNAKRASAQMYFRGLGNTCSSAAYDQGRLTLTF